MSRRSGVRPKERYRLVGLTRLYQRPKVFTYADTSNKLMKLPATVNSIATRDWEGEDFGPLVLLVQLF